MGGSQDSFFDLAVALVWLLISDFESALTTLAATHSALDHVLLHISDFGLAFTTAWLVLGLCFCCSFILDWRLGL